jgi:AmmeMemoRadiSam system protein B
LVLLNCQWKCQSQPSYNKISNIDREPAFAGQFYPGNPIVLCDSLEKMFSHSVKMSTNKNVIAIISPHAGYIYSGSVAASAYKQIKIQKYKNIFVIGSSHKMVFDGASIYASGNYKTPLGIVITDKTLCRKLINENTCFIDYPEAHNGEHTIEVQLPFLQFLLGNNLNLIPIVIGTQNLETCKLIANALNPYFNDSNLFVISTDLSHYPNYTDAQYSDKKITNAIISNSPIKFIQSKNEIE